MRSEQRTSYRESLCSSRFRLCGVVLGAALFPEFAEQACDFASLKASMAPGTLSREHSAEAISDFNDVPGMFLEGLGLVVFPNPSVVIPARPSESWVSRDCSRMSFSCEEGPSGSGRH